MNKTTTIFLLQIICLIYYIFSTTKECKDDHGDYNAMKSLISKMTHYSSNQLITKEEKQVLYNLQVINYQDVATVKGSISNIDTSGYQYQPEVLCPKCLHVMEKTGSCTGTLADWTTGPDPNTYTYEWRCRNNKCLHTVEVEHKKDGE